MNVGINARPDANLALSRIASAIGEPARARMLSSLLDGHARTSTELAVLAEVSPSTASVHLGRLKSENLIKVLVQGKHRYYSLQGAEVASALEALSVLAGNPRARFAPNTPNHLRAARTCYDHIAGTLGVALHDRIKMMGWLSNHPAASDDAYDLSEKGAKALDALGVDVAAARALRRRFAFACLDWSERRSHLGGAIGAALLNVALKRKWLTQHLDSRALYITSHGRRELQARFGLKI
ncbi:MAG: helix-turn-helix transcriptional regulator [Terriglobales bacterium]